MTESMSPPKTSSSPSMPWRTQTSALPTNKTFATPSRPGASLMMIRSKVVAKELLITFLDDLASVVIPAYLGERFDHRMAD